MKTVMTAGMVIVVWKIWLATKNKMRLYGPTWQALMKTRTTKKNEAIYHKKGGPNKTKPAKWTQVFSTRKKKRKKRAKYVSDTKEKRRQKEEREYIQRINDLSKPMPNFFWYGRKRLY